MPQGLWEQGRAAVVDRSLHSEVSEWVLKPSH